jgi:hypothetical protein
MYILMSSAVFCRAIQLSDEERCEIAEHEKAGVRTLYVRTVGNHFVFSPHQKKTRETLPAITASKPDLSVPPLSEITGSEYDEVARGLEGPGPGCLPDPPGPEKG